jgi:hypothetical protein
MSWRISAYQRILRGFSVRRGSFCPDNRGGPRRLESSGGREAAVEIKVKKVEAVKATNNPAT